MSAIKGDFIGFTFGGKHSTELGINRVSNGSRYTETLLPEFSNKTVNVPGANRVDYLGMEFTQKSFPLDIAFDSVTEEQLREMKRLFSTNKPLPLVFDESPYKTYYAKAGGNPSFTYVCFDEGDKRIYKGEGKIDLVSFYPYGFCEPKSLVIEITKANCETLPNYPGLTYESISRGHWGYVNGNKFEEVKEYTYLVEGRLIIKISKGAVDDNGIIDEKDWLKYDFDTGKFTWEGDGINKINNLPFVFYIFSPSCVNVSEWKNSCGFSKFLLYEKNKMCAYNPGDFDAPFVITGIPNGADGSIELEENKIEWSGFSLKDGDFKVRFNSYNQLVEGIDANGNKTGNIYNNYITNGSWFNIPKDFGINSTTLSSIQMTCKGFSDKPILDYKILYI